MEGSGSSRLHEPWVLIVTGCISCVLILGMLDLVPAIRSTKLQVYSSAAVLQIIALILRECVVAPALVKASEAMTLQMLNPRQEQQALVVKTNPTLIAPYLKSSPNAQPTLSDAWQGCGAYPFRGVWLPTWKARAHSNHLVTVL